MELEPFVSGALLLDIESTRGGRLNNFGAVLAGYSHILVDEYQDIDHLQYELVSAIAGRPLEEADQQLSIFKTLDRPNPLLGSLAANGVLVRPASLAERIGQDGLNRHYESLSLEDIYLGYPSRFAPGHPIHRHLADLGAGDIVHLAIENGTIAIQNSQGVCVARLSHKAGAKWRDRLETITEVRVLAMMVRRRQDEGEHPAGQILSERWELPLVEIVYRQR